MRRELIKSIIKYKTPYYLYDKNLITNNIKKLKKTFSRCVTRIFFAVKANTSHALLGLIKNEEIGAEVVSPGEIYLALKAGFDPILILYNNIARTEDDVRYAIKNGIIYYNFEAIDQARLLEKHAYALKKRIKIFARINPGIFPDTHPHLSTGAPSSKFGIDRSRIDDVIQLVKTFHYAQFAGIHVHIGSQILSSFPFVKAAREIDRICTRFKKNKVNVGYINLGGGFGIPYHPAEKKLDFKTITRAYKTLRKKHNVNIFLEPGRFIVGQAGYIISTVISIKQRNKTLLYVIDAGMTENPRPALYKAYHHITPLTMKRGKTQKARIVGPLCENTDEFGIYSIPRLRLGDKVIIHNCGAYTRTMASNYNARLLAPEYLYDKKRITQIRKKQKFKDLLDYESY